VRILCGYVATVSRFYCCMRCRYNKFVCAGHVPPGQFRLARVVSKTWSFSAFHERTVKHELGCNLLSVYALAV